MKKKYYRKRDNNFYLDKTKEEILSEIDYDNPKTFLPYLEILDYPYLEYEWNHYLQLGRGRNLNNIFMYILFIGISFCKLCTNFKTSSNPVVRYPIRKRQIPKSTGILYSGLNCFVIITRIAPAIPINTILKTSMSSHSFTTQTDCIFQKKVR